MLSTNQIEIIKEQAYAGVPSSFSNICWVHPLPIIDILRMGTDIYNTKLGTLLLTEVEIAKLIKEKSGEEIEPDKINTFIYLLQSSAYNDTFLLELQSCFSTFIQEDIMLLPKINAVLVGDPKDKRLITAENFPIFQEILRIQNKKEFATPPPENESEIARKFRLKAEMRDAAKRKQQQKNGETQSFLDLLSIAEVFGIDYQNKTLFAFYELLQRYQAKEKWDQDIQMLCAGADSKNLKTKYWGESLKEK